MTTWDFDTNGDGLIDQRVYDLDQSGTADLWHIDSVGDGYFDQVGVDQNDDGYADAWYSDPNLDGLVDHIWRDTIGDGVADTREWAPAGTSMGWEAFVEPQPFPGETTIGGQGQGWTVTDSQGNPVGPSLGMDTATIGDPIELTPMDRLFVEARQNGSLFDTLTVWNMLQQQRGMSWMY